MAKYCGHRSGEIVFLGSGGEMPNIDGMVGVLVPVHMQGLDLMRDYVVRDGQIVLRTPQPSGARIAMVGVYDVPCGIATYTRSLIDGMRGRVKDIHVFSEYETGAPDSSGLTHCWRRGQPLDELVNTIKAYDPDVIIVQHEYGNFPVARHWLAFLGVLGQYHTIVTLHSVYNHQDKTIVEAACQDIVVHTEGAYQMLKHKQLNGRVTVIPHGCPPPGPRERLWNLYGSSHTILQHGFGFPYKGWENALQTVAVLKNKYSDVFYTGLMSERWPGVHRAYRASLYELAGKLGISENVGLVLGYQSDNVLDAYMRTNRVAFFPYPDNGEHTVYGCSGAARTAMVAGLPVVASGVPLFEDLREVVPTPDSIDGWVSALEHVFEGGGNIAKQDEFLLSHSWEASATQYLDLVSSA
jgi:glycosyltransferase involved in cell wall biosynthesis